MPSWRPRNEHLISSPFAHASIRTLSKSTTLRGSVHDEVRPLGRCCHLLIGLPLKETKPGAAVTVPEAIGQATKKLATAGSSLSSHLLVPPFGCEASALWPPLSRLLDLRSAWCCTAARKPPR